MKNNNPTQAVIPENKRLFEFVNPLGDAKATGTPITSKNDNAIKRKSVV
jgi:hypothetical protein